MRRNDVRLDIITRAIERLIPGATPANLTVTVAVTETLPGTAGHDGEPQKHTWTGPAKRFARLIFTALYGRPREETVTSPRAQAEDAKRARDLVGELSVLMSAGQALESAPWYPCRPGDLVHVHHEAVGDVPLVPAFGETYVIGDAGDGLLSMMLLAHTCTEEDPETVAGMVGCFATEQSDDPLYRPWFEAGPRRLAVVRDGQVVHGTLARPEADAAAAGTKLAAMTMAHAIREAERYLERGEPELALARLRSDVSLAPCATPGPMPDMADCARPVGHRPPCSPDADLSVPPHECPQLPERLHAVVYVDQPGRSVRFGGLYADEGSAFEVANDAAYGHGNALTETTPGPGGHPLILLPADGVAGVAVVGLQLLPDPRAELAWAEEGRDASLSPEDYDHSADDYDADQNGEA